MVKFGGNLLLFFIFLFVAYPCYVIMWGYAAPPLLQKNLNYRVGNEHTFTRLQKVREVRNIDILFLGSSHAFRGFDTRIFKAHGIEAFNLGTSAQTPMQTRTLLKKYFDQINPKLVVFEAYPLTFFSDGVESSLDIITNDKIDFHTMEMVFQVNHIKSYNTLIFALFTNTTGLYRNAGAGRYANEDTYIEGGYVERKMRYNKWVKHSTNRNNRWTPNPRQLEIFKECISQLSQKKVNYLLVQAPITSYTYKSYANNDQIDSLFSTLGPYVNFNDVLPLSDSLDFYDGHHLNQRGVKMFNEEFIDWLQKEKMISVK